MVVGNPMAFQVTPESIERAEHTLAVLSALRMDMAALVAACSAAAPASAVLAVVRWDLQATIMIVPIEALAAEQSALEGDGWSFVFRAGAGEPEIGAAIDRQARLAAARRDALVRYAARHE